MQDVKEAVKISIHALHTKCDGEALDDLVESYRFQSTHFIRSATKKYMYMKKSDAISIHALHTKCDDTDSLVFIGDPPISIHALHTKCDTADTTSTICPSKFQSTHFIRSATYFSGFPKSLDVGFQSTHFIRSATKNLPCDFEFRLIISIHALHTKCDTDVWPN